MQQLPQETHVGSIVEVQTDDAWYEATLLSLSRPGWVIVQQGQQEREVSMNKVRLAIRDDDEDSDDSFVPKLNDVVEVRVPGSGTKPAMIFTGTVRTARKPFFLVSVRGKSRNNDLLVKAEDMRAPAQTRLLSTFTLQEDVFDLPTGLVNVDDTEEDREVFREWLRQFQQQSKVLELRLRIDETAQLKLVAERSRMALASRLLSSIHMRNWRHIARKRNALREMASRLSCVEGCSVEEGTRVDFQIDAEVMKQLLQKPQELQQVEDQLKVSIQARPLIDNAGFGYE
ncbi:unnamed protein product [Effrenium voratum]|nr:unnamed protein product [Effrenium voratum]